MPQGAGYDHELNPTYVSIGCACVSTMLRTAMQRSAGTGEAGQKFRAALYKQQPTDDTEEKAHARFLGNYTTMSRQNATSAAMFDPDDPSDPQWYATMFYDIVMKNAQKFYSHILGDVADQEPQIPWGAQDVDADTFVTFSAMLVNFVIEKVARLLDRGSVLAGIRETLLFSKMPALRRALLWLVSVHIAKAMVSWAQPAGLGPALQLLQRLWGFKELLSNVLGAEEKKASNDGKAPNDNGASLVANTLAGLTAFTYDVIKDAVYGETMDGKLVQMQLLVVFKRKLAFLVDAQAAVMRWAKSDSVPQRSQTWLGASHAWAPFWQRGSGRLGSTSGRSATPCVALWSRQSLECTTLNTARTS